MAKQATAPRLLSVSEVAALKGVTRAAVLGAVREGRLRAERFGVGVRWVWAVAEADAAAWSPRPYLRAPRDSAGAVRRLPREKVLAAD